MKTSLENKFWEMVTDFVIIASFFAPFIVDRERCKLNGRSDVEANRENERSMLLLRFQVVVKTLNLEISRSHLVDYVKELY